MLQYGKNLLRRTLPTPFHAQLWEKFERYELLMLRSQTAAAFKIGTFFIMLILQRSDLQQTELVMQNHKQRVNQEMFDSGHKAFYSIVITLSVGRLVIFGLGFACPSICRTFFYLESLLTVFQSLIPQSMNLEFGDMLILQMQTSILNFMFFYTSFLPCLACSVVVTLLTFALRDLVYIDYEAYGPKIALLIPVLIF